MNALKIQLLCLIFIFSGMQVVTAQRGGGHPNRQHVKRGVAVKQRHIRPGQRVVVVSKYRPATVVVYHPYWGPKYNFHRRWIYFPRYNFYWDNWRQVYFYWDGVMWVNAATPPPVVVNVNIENEKHYELKDTEDDIDDVYNTNETHKSDFKKDNIK